MKKDALENYLFLKMEVENQLERIARAKNNTLIPALKESDGSQHFSDGVDRLGNTVVKWLELEDRLMPSIMEKIAEMQQIECAIESLKNPLEREVLRLRYLDGTGCRHMGWKDVAVNLYGDNDEAQLQAVFRLHRKAIHNFENSL